MPRILLHALSFLLFAATVLPLARLAYVGVRARRGLDRAVPLVLAAAVLLLCGLCHHTERYTGLDSARYRRMAQMFAAGRGLHDPDTALLEVPPSLRPAFFYRPAQPSRDGVFFLDTRSPDLRTRPHFFATLPLAAAALGAKGLDLFVPLVGALCLLVVLLFSPLRFWRGISLFLAPLLPFLLWFLRGFHPDAVGAMLVCAALAVFLVPSYPRTLGPSDSRTPGPSDPRTLGLRTSGLLLGLSLAYHPILAVLAVPLLFCWMIRDGDVRHSLRLCAGFTIGAALLVLHLAFVSNPYFEGLSLASLLGQIRLVPEIRMMAVLLGVAVVLGAAAVVLAHIPRVRSAFLGPSDPRTLGPSDSRTLGLSDPRTLGLSPHVTRALCVAGIALPGLLLWGGAWLSPAWAKGLGAFRAAHPGVLPIVASLCVCAVCLRHVWPSERLYAVWLLCATFFFCFVQGTEVPVGIWSWRRLVPPLAVCLTFFHVRGLDAILMPDPRTAASRRNLRAHWVAVAFLAVLQAATVALQGRFLLASNDRGADAYADAVRERIAGADLAVFDYFPHAAPLLRTGDDRLFGLGEQTAARWPEVWRWIGPQTESGARALLVTSYEPCTMEDGMALSLEGSVTGMVERPVLRSPQDFLQVQNVQKALVQHVLRPVPLAPQSAQRKILDGGPLGQRGEWRRANRGGYWPGKDAGIVGPVPPAGGAVALELSAEGFDDRGNSAETTVVVSLDGGPPLATLVIPAHERGAAPAVVTALLAPASATSLAPNGAAPDGAIPSTGVYRFAGNAVIHSVAIAPAPSFAVSYPP